jgi:hydroxymethylglutaryl-CoA synthase
MSSIIPTPSERVGIDDLKVIIPDYYVDCVELAKYRGIPPEKITIGLGRKEISVAYETNLVEMGVKAIQALNLDLDLDSFSRLYVATESRKDLSKPFGPQILSRLGMNYTQTVDLTFACLAGAQALQDACNYVYRRGGRECAVVLCLDQCVYKSGGTEEFTQGCAAIALKVTRNPSLISCDFEDAGSFVQDVDDFIVPSGAKFPKVEGALSLVSYLYALREAYEDWKRKHKALLQRKKREGISLFDYFDYFIFHTPYPNMAKHAFAMLYRHELEGLKHASVDEFLRDPSLFERDRKDRKAIMEIPAFKELFENKVKPGLVYSEHIGNCYTGSIFLALSSLLAQGVKKFSRIAFGAYGSGMGSLASSGVTFRDKFDAGVDLQLKHQKKLSMEEYEEWRSKI